METIETAIEAGYHAEITLLYKAFSEAMLTAKDNEVMIRDAQGRFKAGLERAMHIRNRARTIAGL